MVNNTEEARIPASSMRHVEVSTPCRLHFGLFAFAGSPWAFGGVGLAIAEPRVRLTFAPSGQFCVDAAGYSDDYSTRIQEFASKFTHSQVNSSGQAELPHCEIKIESAAPQHVGLGLGTQLGLAVAAGIDAFQTGTVRTVGELAAAVARGERSAIGTHTFDQGGLIVDRGQSDDSASRREASRKFPKDWRLLLLTPNETTGLSGPQESSAFANLPSPTPEITEQLRRLALDEMLPALGESSPKKNEGFVEEQSAQNGPQADFSRFCNALGEYGEIAGNCFADVQGGPFASAEIASLVAAVRSYGFAGTGQSSWGPSVYVVTESQTEAESLAKDILTDPRFVSLQTIITSPDNQGAVITIDED